MPKELGILVRMLLPKNMEIGDVLVFNFYYCKKPENIDRQRDLFFRIPRISEKASKIFAERKGMGSLGQAAFYYFPKSKEIKSWFFYPFLQIPEAALGSFKGRGIATKIKSAMSALLAKKFSGYKIGHFGELTPEHKRMLEKAGLEQGKAYTIRGYSAAWRKRNRQLRKRHKP